MNKETVGTESQWRKLSTLHNSSSTETGLGLATTGESASSAPTFPEGGVLLRDEAHCATSVQVMSQYESSCSDAMHLNLGQATAEQIRRQAEREVRDEDFRLSVEAEKARIRSRRAGTLESIFSVLFPFTITIKRKTK